MNRRLMCESMMLLLASACVRPSWAATLTKESGNGSSLSEFEQYRAQHRQEFGDYQKKLLEEFNQFKKIAEKETAAFRKEVAHVWDQPELSSKKVWVEYSSDLSTRNKVDFEKGVIQISTTVTGGQKDLPFREKLTELLQTNQAEAFKKDQLSQRIERACKKSLSLVATAEVEPEPILLPFISDALSVGLGSFEKLVDELMAKKSLKEVVNSQGKKVVTIEVPLTLHSAVQQEEKAAISVTNRPAKAEKIPSGAKTFSEHVSRYAATYNLDPALVFAIIETESAFNPMAKSPIPAFGLMQIVPESAGKDATNLLFGKAKVLAPSYLYSSKKNIEIGAAYLYILYNNYLKDVKDPLTRLYCTIAAYNTGAGNVSKAFTGTKKLGKAMPMINGLTPEEVFNHLVAKLPYKETQNYLKKVVSRIQKYS